MLNAQLITDFQPYCLLSFRQKKARQAGQHTGLRELKALAVKHQIQLVFQQLLAAADRLRVELFAAG